MQEKEKDVTQHSLVAVQDKPACPRSSRPNEGVWLISATIDNLVVELASCTIDVQAARRTEGKTVKCRKYHQQALELRKVMAVTRPTPVFCIDLNDLSPRMVKELHSLSNEDREFVIHEAVGRIFENIGTRIYHLSLARALNVRLQA